MMLTGKAYLGIRQTGKGKHGVTVFAVRSTKPNRYAQPGVWVEVKLEVPEEVFAPYQAALLLPSHGTDAIITVLPIDQHEETG